jgi:hypothetical protein
MGRRPWDVLIYSLESDSSSAASCRVSSWCSQSSRVAGKRLAVDKLRATTPAFRARDAGSGATICCGRLARGGSRGAYGTYIGTSWTTGVTGAGTGARRSSIITLRCGSLITTCHCCRQFPFNYSSHASLFDCRTFELSTELAIATARHENNRNPWEILAARRIQTDNARRATTMNDDQHLWNKTQTMPQQYGTHTTLHNKKGNLSFVNFFWCSVWYYLVYRRSQLDKIMSVQKETVPKTREDGKRKRDVASSEILFSSGEK